MTEGGRPVRTRTRTAEVGSMITRSLVYGVEDEQTMDVEVGLLPGGVEPARVRVHGSATRNLGDYNSARVEVMVELPCLPSIPEVERVYRIASDFVSAQMTREMNRATGVGEVNDEEGTHGGDQGQEQEQPAEQSPRIAGNVPEPIRRRLDI